ncbi:GNAT family N-acetyltransferase, partial [Micromonospora zhanjiangensis]
MDNIVQNSVVVNLSRRPATVEVGPFVIGWDPGTDSRYVNYATPRVGAAVRAADVVALVAAFRRIDRVPRLEYVTSCAPTLEERLLAAGFTVEARHDYLTCTPESLVLPGVPAGVEIAEPVTDDEWAGVIAAQNEAFGGEPVATPEDVARLRRTGEAGGVVLSARDVAGHHL